MDSILPVGASETEAFYGLGETFDSILHRGRVRPMQIEVEIDRESAYNEVHVPVPLLIEGPRRVVRLEAQSEQNLGDMRAYLAQAVQAPAIVRRLSAAG